MTSTYTSNIGIEKPETGDQVGTWGITDNLNYDIVDEALQGYVSITLGSAGSSGSPNDFTITDGALSNGRNQFISFTDAGDLGADVYVRLTDNAREKIGWIENNLSGSRDLYVFQGTYNASNDYVIPAGQKALLRFDGGGTGAVVTNVLDSGRIGNAVAVNLTVAGTLGVTGLTTLSGAAAVTGDVTITTGDVIVDAAQGVDFSANAGTAASGAATTSELLDFYEEGTWTPTITSSTGTPTYTLQAGYFERVGRRVFFNCRVQISAKGSLSGAALAIEGLPYTAVSSSNNTWSTAHVGICTGLAISTEITITGSIPHSLQIIRLKKWSSSGGGGTANIAPTELDDDFLIDLSGHYIAGT